MSNANSGNSSYYYYDGTPPTSLGYEVTVKSDGTKDGTRVAVCGIDVTAWVQWDVPSDFFREDRPTTPPPPTIPAPTQGPCPSCNGRGYRVEAANAGRWLACRGCYGYGTVR